MTVDNPSSPVCCYARLLLDVLGMRLLLNQRSDEAGRETVRFVSGPSLANATSRAGDFPHPIAFLPRQGHSWQRFGPLSTIPVSCRISFASVPIDVERRPRNRHRQSWQRLMERNPGEVPGCVRRADETGVQTFLVRLHNIPSPRRPVPANSQDAGSETAAPAGPKVIVKLARFQGPGGNSVKLAVTVP